MSDEELRMKCLELSIECFSWFKDVRQGIKGSPISLSKLMYQYIKTGEMPTEPYYPQPL